MTNFIMSYSKESKRAYVNVLFDNSDDSIIIHEKSLYNYATIDLKRITDLKNCPDEIWEYVANDFRYFIDIDVEMIKIDYDQIPYLLKHCKYGRKMICELLKDYDIQAL